MFILAPLHAQKPGFLSCLNIFPKKNYIPLSGKIKMLYIQTFQHRAKISSLKKSTKLSPKKKTTSIIQTNSGFSVSQLTRKKISLSKKGKKLKKNVIYKISESLKKRVLTEEHRKNLKKALMGIKNPMFGRLHSKFIKRKIGKNSTKKNIF
jgi:hypothetical protein